MSFSGSAALYYHKEIIGRLIDFLGGGVAGLFPYPSSHVLKTRVKQWFPETI